MGSLLEVSQVSRFDLSVRRPGALGTRARSDDHLLWISRPGNQVPPSLLAKAADAFERDPRVATFSGADSAIAELPRCRGGHRLLRPHHVDEAVVPAAQPAGDDVFVNPKVLDLVGDHIFRGGFCTGHSLRLWATEANSRGLRHHLYWTGADAQGPPTLPLIGLDLIESDDPFTPIGGLVDSFRASHHALSIAVDGSRLGPHETGTQVAAVAWVEGLARLTEIAEIRLLDLPDGQLPEYAAHLARHEKVRVIPAGAERALEPADVFWRPCRPLPEADLATGRAVGRRLVTTVLDLIDYTNEAYHAGPESWSLSRKALREHLQSVDLVTGISQDVVDHVALEMPGLDAGRLRVTTLGVEHLPDDIPTAVPEELTGMWPEARQRRFLLVLGTDFLHKNRDFAIRVWRRLAEAQAVDLVLVGLHVATGSTDRLEKELLAEEDPADGATSVHSQVIRLPHADSRTKSWLLHHADLVLYTSSAEGFGLVPHEAARLGTPSLSTAFGPIKELLPQEALVDTWSIDSYVERAEVLLTRSAERHRQLEALANNGRALDWPQAASKLTEAFRDALRQPPVGHDCPQTAAPLAEQDVTSRMAADELVDQITNSVSWRITRPLRSAASKGRRLRSHMGAFRRRGGP